MATGRILKHYENFSLLSNRKVLFQTHLFYMAVFVMETRTPEKLVMGMKFFVRVHML